MNADQLNRNGRLRRSAAFTGAFIAWASFVMLGLWLIGQICTDRYWWSQWLWWIPTPAILVFLVIGWLTSCLPSTKLKSSRRRSSISAATVCMTLMYFLFAEHHFPPRTVAVPRTSGISVVHWNVEPAIWGHMAPSIDEIVRLDGDITILTNPGGIFQHERIQPWLSEGRQVVGSWPFEIASRVPIKSLRVLIHVEFMFVAMAEFEPTERFNQPLVMYLVDLPSDPRVSRMAMMRRVRKMLDERKVPPPDVVIGDFNITRGSASLSAGFPNTRHAFDEVGTGFGTSFHRLLPLWHIDHMLVGPSVKARRYTLINPGVSRHCVQSSLLSPVHASVPSTSISP